MKYQLLQAVLEITSRCNFRCLHCGSDCKDLSSPNELSVSEWKDCLAQLAEMGARKVTFSGGEPLLRKGLKYLIAHAHDVGLKYGIITNGWRIGPSLIGTMAQYRPYVVAFSLDGTEATHNHIRQNHQSYTRLLRSAAAIKRNRIPIAVVTTLNKLNINELGQTMAFIADFGFDCWQIQLSMPFGRMQRCRELLIDESEFCAACVQIMLYRSLYPQIKIEAADCFGSAPANLIRDDEQYGCGAGIMGLGIDAYGNVLPCLSLRNGSVCGNIRQQPLKEIWEHSPGFSFNREFRLENVGKNCSGCRLAATCRGGCASNSFAYTGDLHNSPFCFLRSFHSALKEVKSDGKSSGTDSAGSPAP